jgi:hypothetical protein
VRTLPEGLAGKSLALGLCLIVIAVIHLAIIAPFVSFYENRAERLQDRLETARRLQRSTEAFAKQRPETDESKEQEAGDALLLPGTNDTVAAALLQSTLKEVVEDAGARLSSAEILPSEARDSFQRVAIHVSLTGDQVSLAAVLRGIELAHPAIFADNIDIHGAGSADDAAANPKLAVELDLYGFRSS